jgi:hypothetical protein
MFSKEVEMTNKCMKKLVQHFYPSGHKPIKTILRVHLTPVIVPIIKKTTTNASMGGDGGGGEEINHDILLVGL